MLPLCHAAPPVSIKLFHSSPFQILVALYFLWKELGPSILAGFFVMIALVPLNIIIAAKTRQLQARQMKEKDQRVKMMNEILQGIKVGFRIALLVTLGMLPCSLTSYGG